MADFELEPEFLYWRIADGRIFYPAEGVFVASSNGSEVIDLQGRNGAATVEDLRETLDFYRERGFDFPLGDLATRIDLVNSVQARYESSFANLDMAALSAIMDGDTGDVNEIAADKQTLRSRMAAEIQAIQEGN